MIIHTNIEEIEIPNAVVSVGTFDGLHLGHREILQYLTEIAKNSNGKSVVFTFENHPRKIIEQNNFEIRLLSSPEERDELFAKAGIDHLILHPFTSEFANLSYREFIENVLIKKIGMRILVIGFNHHLGRNREGNFESILALSKELNFNVVRLEAIRIENIQLSSTKIRNALNEGNIPLANTFLGYKYFISGTVLKGRQLGRTIGFPTANIEVDSSEKLIPMQGVYSVLVHIAGKQYQGMLNIGFRPTIASESPVKSIEVNIFNFDQDIYGSKIRVYFVSFIRNEQKFESIDALKEQLHQDKKRTISIISSLPQ